MQILVQIYHPSPARFPLLPSPLSSDLWAFFLRGYNKDATRPHTHAHHTHTTHLCVLTHTRGGLGSTRLPVHGKRAVPLNAHTCVYP